MQCSCINEIYKYCNTFKRVSLKWWNLPNLAGIINSRSGGKHVSSEFRTLKYKLVAGRHFDKQILAVVYIELALLIFLEFIIKQQILM